jgi:phosphoribosylglycinamide formyltransferase 1
MVAHHLAQHYPLSALILERSPSPMQVARRRATHQGALKVSGQVLFVAFSRLLAVASKRRMAQIRERYDLCAEVPEGLRVIEVNSVNDDHTVQLLRSLAPTVVVVNGTRIIAEKVLRSVDAPFINTHAGITPKYRGVHGGYWALARQDRQNAGVSVHLVDPGIDTGAVLYQARIDPSRADNFATYPLLQLAAGLPLLKAAIDDALNGRLRAARPDLPSELFYHPTLWGYLWTWTVKGVR